MMLDALQEEFEAQHQITEGRAYVSWPPADSLNVNSPLIEEAKAKKWFDDVSMV